MKRRVKSLNNFEMTFKFKNKNAANISIESNHPED